MYTEIRRDGKLVGVFRSATNTCIPLSLDNSDYQAFIKWQDAQPPESKLDLSDKEPDPLPVEERRKQEYEKRGVTIEAMTVALWEAQVENRPEALNALQVIRNQIKTDIPKIINE